MALGANERYVAGSVRDLDNRLVVVGPDGVAIGGVGGGGPVSEGVPGAALPAKTLWVAGSDGVNLQGLKVDGTGRLLVVLPAGGTGLTDTELRAAPVPVVTQEPISVDDNGGSLTVDGTFWQATQPVSGTFWQATQPVSGTFWQATQPVSGTFWQATQPVSGPLTDAQLRAAPVPVTGGGGGTEYTEGDTDATITGSAILWEDAANTLKTVNATNRLPVALPAGGSGLTDTELRATPVPVSGSVTADTELPAAAALSDTTANPTSPMVGAGGMVFNGTDWRRARQASTSNASIVPTGVPVVGNHLQDSDDGAWRPWQTAALADGVSSSNSANVAPILYNGATYDRLRGDATNGMDVDVTRVQGSVAVTGTFWQATQPVSGTFWQATQPVSGTFWQATQPVSMATNTPDVTDRAAREVGRVRLWDGTDEATVLPVRTVPATTEKAIVTTSLPQRINTYQCVTAEVAPAITIGVKELLNFFHPAAVTVDVHIVEIVVSVLVTTASTGTGRTNVEVFKTTSAGTGGVNVAGADIGGGLATSAVITNAAANVMQVKTGGGALGVKLIGQGIHWGTVPLSANRHTILAASNVGQGIILRAGSADGINIQINRVAAHTALVDQWTASIRWIEL